MATANFSTNDDLFSLIKGLSGNEKSYYKKLAKRHATENRALHLKLFDIIDRSTVIDEKKFMQQLNITNATQYSSLKNHLGRDVLDAIVFQKRNDTINISLHFLMIQLEQLLEKKLLVLARRLFKKAWELANGYEQYDAQLWLLQFQNRLLEHQSFKEYKNETVAIAQKLQQVIVFQQQQQQLNFLTEQLHSLRKNTPLRFTNVQQEEVNFIRKELDNFIDHGKTSPRILWTYYAARAAAEHMLQQYEQCQATSRECRIVLESNLQLIQSDPECFLSMCNTIFYNDFAMNNVKIASAHLSRLEPIAKEYLNNDYYRKRWQIIVFNTTLKIAHKKADYDAVERHMNEAPQMIEYVYAVMLPSDQLSILCSICISLFVLEKWDNAEALLIDIKELNRSMNREDILYFSLVFHLLILYEKREWYRLDSATEAAYHLLYARSKLRPFEKELMLFLKRLVTERSKTDTANLIRNFLLKLDEFKKDPVQLMYFLYFNYYGWLESKLQRISYREYRKNMLAANG